MLPRRKTGVHLGIWGVLDRSSKPLQISSVLWQWPLLSSSKPGGNHQTVMKKIIEKKGWACSFCGRKPARAFKIAGILLRYACDECFAARCMSCGNICEDEHASPRNRGRLEVHDVLYCKTCLGMSDSNRPAGHDEAGTHPGYFEICRARPLGIALEFAECLVTPPSYCPYRQSLYGNHYCFHPRRHEIIKLSGEE